MTRGSTPCAPPSFPGLQTTDAGRLCYENPIFMQNGDGYHRVTWCEISFSHPSRRAVYRDNGMQP